MKKRTILATAVSLSLAGLVPAAPAHAASATSVTSPSCGTVKVMNTATWSGEQGVMADNDAFFAMLPKGQSSVTKDVPAGTYTWHASDYDKYEAYGRVTVKACSAVWPKRRTPGDQNGDGRSDVLGIHGSTGMLYYYRMTSTGLASGVKAGTGWSNMLWMQQVDDISINGSTGNYLFAVHRNGTVWRYPNKGQGRFGAGVQVGAGFSKWSNFTVLPANNSLIFGNPLLLASDGQRLYAYSLLDGKVDSPIELSDGWGGMSKTIAVRDFDGNSVADLISIDQVGVMRQWRIDWDAPDVYDGLAYPVKQVGTGWNAMGIVSSPGTLNGDWNSDLIARRRDGNLYKYINAGGRWYAGQQIGTRWNQIRLLA